MIKLTIEPKALSHVLKKLREAGYPVEYTSRSIGSDEFTLYFHNIVVEDDIATISNSAIKEWKLSNIESWDHDNIRNLTRDELITHIDNSITDLASAKIYLKKLSAVVLYLVKRITDEE